MSGLHPIFLTVYIGGDFCLVPFGLIHYMLVVNYRSTVIREGYPSHPIGCAPSSALPPTIWICSSTYLAVELTRQLSINAALIDHNPASRHVAGAKMQWVYLGKRAFNSGEALNFAREKNLAVDLQQKSTL